MSHRFDVCVLGSCNMDLACRVENQPKAGETIEGFRYCQSCGGKGANQCVMAAKLEAKCAFIGKLGKDANGQKFRDTFEDLQVDTSCLATSENEMTGVALITVDKSGQNQIVVCLGANNELSSADVDAASDIILQSKILLCQLEVPSAANYRAMKIAKENPHNTITVLNVAPAAKLDNETYTVVDFLVVNESEATLLSDIEVIDIASAERAAKVLQEKGSKSIIVTMGGHGVAVLLPSDSNATEFFFHIPAKKIEEENVIDTTGAGDSFIGAFAYFLTVLQTSKDIFDSNLIRSAVHRANEVAALTIQKHGTQSSYPNRSEIDSRLFDPLL